MIFLTVGGSHFWGVNYGDYMAEKRKTHMMWSFYVILTGENHIVWANNGPSRMLHTLHTCSVHVGRLLEEPRGSQEEPISNGMTMVISQWMAWG